LCVQAPAGLPVLGSSPADPAREPAGSDRRTRLRLLPFWLRKR
jgi:hypothetical protein